MAMLNHHYDDDGEISAMVDLVPQLCAEHLEIVSDYLTWIHNELRPPSNVQVALDALDEFLDEARERLYGEMPDEVDGIKVHKPARRSRT